MEGFGFVGGDLLLNQGFFQQALSCGLGDGNSICFLSHKWLGNASFSIEFPSLYCISI